MEDLGLETLPTRTVLVVDDQQDILDSLRDLLEASLDGVQVRIALSGQEALKLLGSEQIDLIVSDYKMPGMDGLQFLEEAKKIAPQTPRILITAFPDLDLAIRAINDARIENFFTKPLDPNETIRIVEDTLDETHRRHLRDQAFSRAMDMASKKSQAQGGGRA